MIQISHITNTEHNKRFEILQELSNVEDILKTQKHA